MLKQKKWKFLAIVFILLGGVLLGTYIYRGNEARSPMVKGFTAILEDIYVRDEEDSVYFGNSLIELRFSKGTGSLMELFDKRSGRSVMRNSVEVATELLTVGGRLTSTTSWPYNVMAGAAKIPQTLPEYLWYRVDIYEGGVKLTLGVKTGSWYLYPTYQVDVYSPLISKTLRIAYFGADTILLSGMDLALPPAVVGENWLLEAPGDRLKPHLPVARVAEMVKGAGGTAALGWTERNLGLIALHDPSKGTGFMTWAFSDVEPFYPIIKLDRGELLIQHHLIIADRFSGGHILEVGTQYIYAFRDGLANALKFFRDWWSSIGVKAPEDTAIWARSAAIYELHIGSYWGYSPFPDARSLIEALPRIREMGFSAIQIMPGYRGYFYSVIDYFNVTTQYGLSAEELKALVDDAHRLGLRVILDWVIHGSNKLYSKLHLEHPEWYMRNEDGAMLATYTWSFNQAHKGWQDYTVSAMKFYVQEFNVDGFRVDAPFWNNFPNWDPSLPYRASYSTFGGVKTLLERARRELKALRPEVALYLETPGPQLLSFADFQYNYDEHWILFSLPPTPADLASVLTPLLTPLTAQEASEWFNLRELAFPKGFTKAHHVDSHDTWYGALNILGRDRAFMR